MLCQIYKLKQCLFVCFVLFLLSHCTNVTSGHPTIFLRRRSDLPIRAFDHLVAAISGAAVVHTDPTGQNFSLRNSIVQWCVKVVQVLGQAARNGHKTVVCAVPELHDPVLVVVVVFTENSCQYPVPAGHVADWFFPGVDIVTGPPASPGIGTRGSSCALEPPSPVFFGVIVDAVHTGQDLTPRALEVQLSIPLVVPTLLTHGEVNNYHGCH